MFFITELGGKKEEEPLEQVSRIIPALDVTISSVQNTKSALSYHNRSKTISKSMVSRYAHIPTENLKFQQFIDALFASKMTRDDIKDEIKGYVSALETNYNDTIRQLKRDIERLQKKAQKLKTDRANEQTEKTEFEAIFVECIEDVRKEIMKRRLKSEMVARKQAVSKKRGGRTGSVGVQATFDDPEEEASREFEESLMKLASFAKGKIKYEDFTSKDKFNILDLFVNNEKTLVKIYEALFPHRAKNILPNVSSQSSGLTTDRTVGRYGYHSGVAPPETHATNPHLL